MFYEPIDYAYDFASRVGWGTDWSEKIAAITNRATYTANDKLPSGGTDWFTRIREGASDYASISLVGEITTNGFWGADMHKNDPKNERVKMELVGDHTWRYHYYIPTNNVPTNGPCERIRFHFTGLKYEQGEAPFSYTVASNVWYANSTNVPYVPFTMTVKTNGAPYDAEVQLDGSGTHLQIDFNDEIGSFSLSHGTYQNFNAWTDAMEGYRGNYSSTSGVSDVKQRWDAAIDKWKPTEYAKPSLWREAFDLTPEQEVEDAYRCYQRGAFATPNGWTVENGMYVPRRRDNTGRAVQLEGRGKGALMLNSFTNNTTDIPNGVGTVTFSARVSQIPLFEDFCYNALPPLSPSELKTYAVAAKVTMSRLYESTRSTNPSDISPANPSVSLIGYHRGSRYGCYEFRATRSGNTALTVALYRWKNDEATCLASNIVYSTGNATIYGSQSGLGKTIDGGSGSSSSLNGFGNLLLPADGNQTRDDWSWMCLSLFTAPDNTVKLKGYLSKQHNNKTLEGDKSAVLCVVSYDDMDTDLGSRGGTFGVGSVGCQAAFGLVSRYEFSDPSNENLGINTTSGTKIGEFADWEYGEHRWRMLAYGETEYNDYGFTALIPSDQTVKLVFAKPGGKDGGWFESGWETNVTSFATNQFTFAPCEATDYFVRLQTGDSDSEIVIEEAEVRSWRAGDMPDLYLASEEWAYTMGSIETSAVIEGLPYDLQAAGTNGYAFIFNKAGVATFTPQFDVVIDRVLVVGGGGSGGSTMGGGGGGGGVVEGNWENAPVTVPAGRTISITVGAGGKAPVPVYSSGSANTTSQPAGNNGGDSFVSGIPGKSLATAKGGGGGSGWSVAAKSGGSGGGGASGRAGAGGTANQGYAGGTAVTGASNAYGLGGGGGGGGAAGQNGQGATFEGGKGGDGKPSDITGVLCYYGGGGGGGVGWKNTAVGGAGGKCGPANKSMDAGHGASYHQETTTLTAGLDGYGGGGGGGTYYDNGSDANVKKGAGAAGGCGCVILRVRTASKVCVLQPTRSYPLDNDEYLDHPMSVRSKYLENGLSLFSFSYKNADSNAVVSLQISTNLLDIGYVEPRTLQDADNQDWTTLTNWTFKGLPPDELAEGSRTYFLSLRAPQKGLMRLIVPPSLVSNALARAKNLATRDLDYGKITITRIFCYDEPELDGRSWWGWNLHTRGWNEDIVDKTKRWAYLTDSPDGLSCSLNFSALENDNKKTDAATAGIGLGEDDKEAEYKENNPFVQCPEMTNGIGSVSFRARTFETNTATAAAHPAVLTLYASSNIGSYQPDPLDGQSWERLAEFVITNTTYQTYSWKTNEDTVAAGYRTIRLEVAGARHGRGANHASDDQAWEKPSYANYRPIQRVFLDEVSVSEPVGPRLKFFDVRPFRSNLDGGDVVVITNINSRNEQPLLDESWGIQARIEPQQMADELNRDSIRVYMAAYVGIEPWGYKNWQSIPLGENRYEAELTCVDRENLIFRSTVDKPESIIMPSSADSGLSYAVVQYHVWATYRKKDSTEGQAPTSSSLTSADWVMPEWYWPKNLNEEYGFGVADNFSAFTILDTISPGRAWLNEVNYNNDGGTRSSYYQFIEMMAPEHVSLKDWTIRLTSTKDDDQGTLYRGDLVRLGSAAQPLTPPRATKVGLHPGIDSTNQFTVLTFIPPTALEKGVFTEEMRAAGKWDAAWNKGLNDNYLNLVAGALNYSDIYGIELVRPSGVVEHQIIVAGTNIWEGTAFESRDDVELQVANIKSKRGPGNWFFAGSDRGGDTPSLGVWRGHGEELLGGQPTWTNDMQATPGELNVRNGRRQEIEGDWMLPPNGTNVWIYSTVLGKHTWQYVDGNPAHTNKSALLVVRGGASTNILYKVDAWYELADCTTNGFPAKPELHDAASNTFKIQLTNVTKTVNILVNDQGDSRLFGTNYSWQLTRDDPYTPAILDWLLSRWPDKGPDNIQLAEQWDLNKVPKGKLDLKAMYWLDIPPVEPGWKLMYGFMTPPSSFETTVQGVTYSHNTIFSVKMLITNATETVTTDPYGLFHPPKTIRGLRPGSSSATDYATITSPNWTSATFKVKARISQQGTYKPVKWFVFNENSFNQDGISYIEVPDQTNPQTPGFTYGWHNFPGSSFLYTTSLDEKSSGLYMTEILRAVHTNSYPGVSSP